MHFFPPLELYTSWLNAEYLKLFILLVVLIKKMGSISVHPLFSHQEQHKSSPGTLMILITLFFIRSCGKSPLVPSHDELPRNLHQENS